MHAFSEFNRNLQKFFFNVNSFQLSLKEQPERVSQNITLDLQGIGISLVNDEKSIEVAYIGIQP